MQFQDLHLEHKVLFDKIFARQIYENSWFNFSNLFIWQNAYRPKWALSDDCLYITLDRDGVFYAFPPFVAALDQFNPAVAQFKNYFDATGRPFILKGLSLQMTEHLINQNPHRYTATPRRDRYDYVYRSSDLQELKGRRYHAKRNHVNKFSLTYPDWSYINITEAQIPACLEVAKRWCEYRQCGASPDLYLEHQAIETALNNFTSLGLKGGAISIKGKIEAFSLGELTTPDMAVIHVEKANPEINGLYAVINQQFCRNCWSETLYINREEDLGVHGLRKAKESYLPVKLIEKYDITLDSPSL